MPRHFFRKIVPSEHAMRQNRVVRLFGSSLLSRRFWHLNRHSTAWGVASGLLFAFVPLPIQTLAAVSAAIVGRGNVALAVAFTWVSNPLTWLPCFMLSYQVGRLITGTPPIPNLMEQVKAAMDAGLVEGSGMAVQMLWEDLPHFYPLIVGGLALGAASAVLAFVIVKLAWRWHVVRRWHTRHEQRRRFNPAQRLTSGFAHLHRIASRGRGSRRHETVTPR